MRCPACEKEMDRRTYGKLTIDICLECEGVWFDRDEMHAFIKAMVPKEALRTSSVKTARSTKDDDVQLLESERSCPVCAKPMIKFNYGMNKDIVLDRCKKCNGIWTDANEVFDVAEFLHKRYKEHKKLNFMNLKKGSVSDEPLKLAKSLQNFIVIYMGGGRNFRF